MRITPTTDATATLRLFLPLLDAEALAVLQHRFGLGGRVPRTLPQTAELMRIPITLAYALERQAIADLRRLMRSD